MSNTLQEAIKIAREADHFENGKCSMCAIGHKQESGVHTYNGEDHRCGNFDTCLMCHNAGMEYGEQCQACGRIEQ